MGPDAALLQMFEVLGHFHEFELRVEGLARFPDLTQPAKLPSMPARGHGQAPDAGPGLLLAPAPDYAVSDGMLVPSFPSTPPSSPWRSVR
jgi:hypothetical protein